MVRAWHFFMGYTLATVKRRHRAIDTLDLPLVYIEILVNGFGGEARTAPTGALGKLLKPLFC